MCVPFICALAFTMIVCFYFISFFPSLTAVNLNSGTKFGDFWGNNPTTCFIFDCVWLLKSEANFTLESKQKFGDQIW